MASKIEFIRLVPNYYGHTYYDIVYQTGRIRVYVLPEDMPKTALEFIRSATIVKNQTLNNVSETIYKN